MKQILDLGYSRKILLCMAENGGRPLRFKILLERLGIPKSTLSRRLDIMQDLNLIELIPDKDNFCFVYCLTETGTKVAQQYNVFDIGIKSISPALIVA